MGPLAGIKVVEFAGVGPVPMCAMLLADLGATVLRIDRLQAVELGVGRPLKFDLLLRGRKAIGLDLKDKAAIEFAHKLLKSADVLLEGFRPGVMERLGLGPEQCFATNPKLVYARLTGWGQTGPLAPVAAHDINYIALTGALYAIGRSDQPPTPPLNLLGDFAGGSLYAALGILSAYIEAQKSGTGQVIDSAVVDGTIALMTHVYGGYAAGVTKMERGQNFSDSGAYFYDVYRCKDGEWISIGPLEKRFFDLMLGKIGIDPGALPPQKDRTKWKEGRDVLAKHFAGRSRAEWCALLEGTDVCFAPVLSAAEAPDHEHNRARGNFVTVDGIVQPAPAPKFSRSVPEMPSAPEAASTGKNVETALNGWMAADEIAAYRARGLLQ